MKSISSVVGSGDRFCRVPFLYCAWTARSSEYRTSETSASDAVAITRVIAPVEFSTPERIRDFVRPSTLGGCRLKGIVRK